MFRTIRNMMLALAVFCMAAYMADAQPGKRYYINAGWQFNGVVGNDFVSNASGWGAYLEGGYYVLPRIAAGAFASYGTNNEYIPRTTYVASDGSALTSDCYNSIFQIPFGATLRYRLNWKRFEPYAEAKLGANYASEYIYYPTATSGTDQWGFYVSPEVGFTWHPFRRNNFGFQFAVYYSYATNRCASLGIDGISNAGFKLGLSF